MPNQRTELRLTILGMCMFASSGYIYDHFGYAWTAFTVAVTGIVLMISGSPDREELKNKTATTVDKIAE